MLRSLTRALIDRLVHIPAEDLAADEASDDPHLVKNVVKLQGVRTSSSIGSCRGVLVCSKPVLEGPQIL